MGGKGRGVFSDFRLGRVCSFVDSGARLIADVFTVSIQDKCARWKLARREEGELVEWICSSVEYVYTMAYESGIGWRCNKNCTWDYNITLKQDERPLTATRCTFTSNSLSPQQAGTNGRANTLRLTVALVLHPSHQLVESTSHHIASTPTKPTQHVPPCRGYSGSRPVLPSGPHTAWVG
jgi:hypothetical protein